MLESIAFLIVWLMRKGKIGKICLCRSFLQHRIPSTEFILELRDPSIIVSHTIIKWSHASEHQLLGKVGKGCCLHSL